VTGPGTFSFTVAAATDTTARTGALTVAGQSVSVSQQGLTACAYALLPAGRSFDAVGGTSAVDVNTTSTCSWTVASSAPWLTVVSGGSGTGNGTVTYAVAPNADASSRIANLAVGDRAHAVTQSGLASCAVTIEPDDETFPVSGGSRYFDVSASSSCAWLAASSASWIRVTEPADGFGTGNRRVSYVVDANSGAVTRTGTITVGGKAFVATQAGTSTCVYSVTPVDYMGCEYGGGRTVTVDTAAGCGWTASTGASWITISSGRTALGPGTFTFTLPGNYDEARQGIIEVRWPTPTAGQNVRVAQAGCNYAFSPDSFVVSSCGGDFLVYVFSGSTDSVCGGRADENCVWSAQSHASWITVLSPMPRRGLDRFSFRVAASDGVTIRTSTITVQYRTLTIWQGPGPCRRP
jgi:WD40 repeat protein